MKRIYLFILIIKGCFLFSQITIGEIKKTDAIPGGKSIVYNGIDNFVFRDSYDDNHYKIYLGLKFYNPPYVNTEDNSKDEFKGRLKEFSNSGLISSNKYTVFTDSVSKIDLEEFVGQKFYYNDKMEKYGESEKSFRPEFPTIAVKNLYTIIYNPKPIFNQGNIEIITDPEQFNNRYFTLIDVLTDTKFDEFFEKNIKTKLLSYKNYSYKDLGANVYTRKDIYLGVLFKFQDDITKKEFYVSEEYIKNFIFVPFFVNQKNLYDSKLMVKGHHQENNEDSTIKDPNLVYKSLLSDKTYRSLIFSIFYKHSRSFILDQLVFKCPFENSIRKKIKFSI